MKVIGVVAEKYEDDDNCLEAAAADIAVEYGLDGWDLDPRWQNDSREVILLTLPE